MWTVIRMVKGKPNADAIEDAFIRAGILVKKKKVYKNIPDAENYFELQVLSSEAEAANELLVEMGK